MSIASTTQPIKVGVLVDFGLPPGGRWQVLQDFLDALSLVFRDATSSGMLDRPIELVVRECEGLPRGAVAPVIRAFGELVDEGCVIVSGPMISENAIALREEIERTFRVPAISWCGTDSWLGEWTFALSNGSLTDEPYVLANLMAQAGLRRIGVSYERSQIGHEYLNFFHDACDAEGVSVAAAVPIAQSGVDATEVVDALRAANPDALLHLGFGLGMVGINGALAAIDWDPPRYTTTAWENGFIDDEIFATLVGWIGLEQYDEENPVAVAFLDRFEKEFGRRPEYYAPGYGHDVANAIVHALAKARPLSPRGVKEALERVKMLPAASGAAGTRISFGQWTRRGWMGASYLIAREVAPDLSHTMFRGRVGPPRLG